MKDPNAPKKPLSAYFLFSQEERLKVKATNPELSITEVSISYIMINVDIYYLKRHNDLP
jgi:hypothetical protein